MNLREPDRPYHHGELAPSLRESGGAIWKKKAERAFAALCRARAGVSHAAPYRHYPSREALLAMSRAMASRNCAASLRRPPLCWVTPPSGSFSLAAPNLRFASRHADSCALMFGSELPTRDFPGLAEPRGLIGEDIGPRLGDPAAGLAAWAAMHGLALLILENVIDLGQKQAGLDVVPSRAGILLRSFVEALRD